MQYIFCIDVILNKASQSEVVHGNRDNLRETTYHIRKCSDIYSKMSSFENSTEHDQIMHQSFVTTAPAGIARQILGPQL